MTEVLIIAPHPDDIEFTIGGTVAKLAGKGLEIVCVVLTKGEMGTRGSPEIRLKEMQAASKTLGTKLEVLDFEDCKIENNHESRLKVANIIRKHKPSAVFAPYHTNEFSHNDPIAHPDHYNTGQLIRHALRLAKFEKVKLDYPAHHAPNLFYFMVPRQKMPIIVSDITDYYDKWLEAAKCHASQIPDTSFLEDFAVMKQYYGGFIKAKYGEPFLVDEPLKMNLEMLK